MVASPIYISKRDTLTAETAKEILAYDKTGQINCGWNRR